MKKIILSFLTIASFGAIAQNVNIPDANFKAYLVGNTSVNTNSDNEIQVSEALAFNGLLNCQSQSISDLTGIEAFTGLTILYCNNNSLTSLDLSANINLTELYCANNQLTTLDISSNTSLIKFHCFNNLLTSVNVANGNNSNFTLFQATSNPNLTCVQVDNVAYSTTNWTNVDATTNFSTNCSSTPCTVNIPDANFKAYLVGNTAINTNGNTEIECNEANSYTGAMNCHNQNISDLTGIESFTMITSLSCRNNSLTTLDLSQNTQLTELTAHSNQLTSIDLTQNTLLTYLRCNNNPLSTLDVTQNINLNTLLCYNTGLSSINLSQNSQLQELNCYDNMLTMLDISANPNLVKLTAYNNQLTNLNTSQNLLLEELYVSTNDISSFDFTQNTALTKLSCAYNELTSLNLSQNNLLELIFCNHNQITTLDLAQNTNLLQFACTANELNYLNLANGQNTLITYFISQGNPNLACIQVDDAAYSTTNWTSIDATSSFSENCGSVGINESNNVNISIYPNPTNGVVTFDTEEKITSIAIFNLAGQKVSEFNNQKTIDISNLPNGIYAARVIVGSNNFLIKRLIKN